VQITSHIGVDLITICGSLPNSLTKHFNLRLILLQTKNYLFFRKGKKNSYFGGMTLEQPKQVLHSFNSVFFCVCFMNTSNMICLILTLILLNSFTDYFN
jgi:hypothetical protein